MLMRLALPLLCCCTSLALASPMRVGLVLGGGGARGAAHIGVLEVLEQQRVPIACVAGTSMGALVAGAYAAGLTPAQMRSKMDAADWTSMFQDSPTYDEMGYRNKRISQRYLPGLETGLKPDGLQYQSGAVTGQRIKLFFNDLVGAENGEPQIESLALPLAIIATDIGSGERVVLKQGSLTRAMRASMSVPGLMSPLIDGGRRLVDGGLVDNVPIDVVRELCQPDLVIAVNVGSPLLRPEEVTSLLSVSAQMINILTEQNVSRSLASLAPQDVYIKPDLQGLSAADFPRHREISERGRLAALAALPRLSALGTSPEGYLAWQQARSQTGKRQALPVGRVDVAELAHVNPAAVTRHLEQETDAPLAKTTGRDLLRVFGDGYYESVDYALLGGRDKHILRVTPLEKSWGPDYLRFGINLESNLDARASYALRAALHKTWLNALGGEMLVSAQVGSETGVSAEFYQPLDEAQHAFAETHASVLSRNRYFYQDDQKLAEYLTRTGLVSAGFGLRVGLLGQAKLGWQQKWRRGELETGRPELPQDSRHYGGWFATLDLDQINRLYLPTDGWAARAHYFDSDKEGFGQLLASVSASRTLGPLIGHARLSASQTLRGRTPFYEAPALGGFLNLTGFAPQQLVGDNMRFAQLRLEHIVGRLPLGLRGDMRVGLALEGATFGQRYSETTLEGWQRSAALYLGGETPLGAAYLGYGYGGGGRNAVYLFLGTP
ncbi:patatin [Crenobacter intestini]|uniref:Patatin n=2 Tax=Crenobacter intestini TaxID=2563443 RepID=A0A4T0UZK4_9NEIS|nr:patatin [Crenobacter intestini]